MFQDSEIWQTYAYITNFIEISPHICVVEHCTYRRQTSFQIVGLERSQKLIISDISAKTQHKFLTFNIYYKKVK